MKFAIVHSHCKAAKPKRISLGWSDHPWGWWGWSLSSRARTAGYNEKFPPLWAPKFLERNIAVLLTVLVPDRGPEGRWSSAEFRAYLFLVRKSTGCDTVLCMDRDETV